MVAGAVLGAAPRPGTGLGGPDGRGDTWASVTPRVTPWPEVSAPAVGAGALFFKEVEP